jgi:hypothetical protein
MSVILQLGQRRNFSFYGAILKYNRITKAEITYFCRRHFGNAMLPAGFFIEWKLQFQCVAPNNVLHFSQL